jgi:hypothetical protein
MRIALQGMRDPRVLWLFGAVVLVSCSIGLVAAATMTPVRLPDFFSDDRPPP